MVFFLLVCFQNQPERVPKKTNPVDWLWKAPLPLTWNYFEAPGGCTGSQTSCFSRAQHLGVSCLEATPPPQMVMFKGNQKDNSPFCGYHKRQTDLVASWEPYAKCENLTTLKLEFLTEFNPWKLTHFAPDLLACSGDWHQTSEQTCWAMGKKGHPFLVG